MRTLAQSLLCTQSLLSTAIFVHSRVCPWMDKLGTQPALNLRPVELEMEFDSVQGPSEVKASGLPNCA